MNLKRLGLPVAALLFGAALTASAQTHSIRIDDGLVYVDGRLQLPGDLPQSLRLDGVSAQLSFSGATHFRLGDRVFHVKQGRLAEVEPSDNDFVVFVNPSRQSGLRLYAAEEADTPRWTVGNTFGVYYDLLGNHVKTLDALHQEFSREQTSPVAERLKQSAEQTALMVRAFPRIEFQTYLEEIQDRNVGLYDGILREQLMEVESRRLASRINATADEGRRTLLVDQLREQLDNMFQLKQQNRIDEIDQLETRLLELRSQLRARETHRDEIIERRIRELLTGRGIK